MRLRDTIASRGRQYKTPFDTFSTIVGAGRNQSKQWRQRRRRLSVNRLRMSLKVLPGRLMTGPACSVHIQSARDEVAQLIQYLRV